jgi:hypothetical protein
MTISIAGNPLKPNLSYLDILTNLRDLFTSNWAETSPPLDDGTRLTGVTFNFDWYDGLGEFQVSLKSPITTTEPENIGWTMFRNDMFVEVHVWTKQLSEVHPQKCANIVKEIQRILDDNKQALASSGMSYLWLSAFEEIPEGDATVTLWHYVASVNILFRRVET